MTTRRFSASVSMMFRELALPERFAAARACGFEGVEIQFLAEGEPRAMAAAARDAGVDVILVNVGMGDLLGGGPGLSGVPGREEAYHLELGKAFDAAADLGARFVHLGPSRIPAESTREACLATYRRNVAAAIDLARERGLAASLVIEAMNRVEGPTALLNDVDDVAALIRAEFEGAAGILFDVYHTAMNGRDVSAAYRAHRDLVRHVQFSDVPGRHEPGTGSLDFAVIFAALEAAGYAGWYGAEYFPTGPTAETVAWLPRLGGGTAKQA